MTFVVQRTVRGRENRAVGQPAGRENMTPGVTPPLQPIITSELGTGVSTTIAWATNVATATATAHGLVIGNIVRIAGAEQAYFNGDFRVDSRADANTFTYAVYGSGLEASATGTITCRKVV
jgi:hypothetical protein